LLGASPGASTATAIMINVLKKCFPGNFNGDEWQQKLKDMIPTLEKPWAEYAILCQEIREWTSDVLELNT
jgi:malate dehydrogenase (quinone)